DGLTADAAGRVEVGHRQLEGVPVPVDGDRLLAAHRGQQDHADRLVEREVAGAGRRQRGGPAAVAGDRGGVGARGRGVAARGRGLGRRGGGRRVARVVVVIAAGRGGEHQRQADGRQ